MSLTDDLVQNSKLLTVKVNKAKSETQEGIQGKISKAARQDLIWLLM